MADVEPIKSIRYEPSVAGPLEDVIAPPHDVIDEELRAELVARSPRNVVEIDLPEPPRGAVTAMSTPRPRCATGSRRASS